MNNALWHFGNFNPTFFTKKTLTSLIITCCLSATYAQLSISTNIENSSYKTGDNASFIISSSTSGTVNYTLKYDRIAAPISTGSINITAGQPEIISHTESSPGAVFCEVKQGGNSDIASALFSPYDIAPFTSAPNDLQSFWDAKKQELSSVALNPVVTHISSTIYSDSYSVRLDNIDGRKIYGYLSVPKSTGPFPAIITLPPFGEIANITVVENELAERAGVLSMSISIHNVAPDQVDPNAYSPDNYENEDENYYKYGLLGAVQAINYIFSRPDFDNQNVGVTGISQGGGLAICLAGIDDRINLLMYSLPTHTQNAGLAYGKAGGFPNYIHRSRSEDGTSAHETATIDATKYYDGMFLAQGCDYPVYGALSYRDTVSPPATGLAAFNALPNTHPRILIHSIGLGHNNPPFYFQGRVEFIHRYFPSSVGTTPFPWNNKSGYDIDAGAPATAYENTAYPLNGSILQNTTVNPEFDLEWSVISGPGAVSFSNPNSYNPTATFSATGTYQLQFRGWDNSNLATDQQYIYLVDYINITVEPFVPLPVELVNFSSELKDEKVLLQWVTASEINNKGFEVQRTENDQNRFETIGFVQGLNTAQGGTYSFWDKNVEQGKTYYYRLKQLDTNGDFDYSSIVSETIPVRDFEIKVYPNVVKEKLNISILGKGIQEGNLLIFSSEGKLLMEEKITLDNQLDKTISVNKLTQGIYWLQIELPQMGSHVFSFVKN